MRRGGHRTLAIAILGLALAGCTGQRGVLSLGAGTRVPVAESALMPGDQPLGLISNNAGSLQGSVTAPSAGLIANNAAGIIDNNGSSLIANNAAGLLSNNSGGLISNNSGGLISNNSGGYRVLVDALVPASGATIGVSDLAGASLSDEHPTSDAQGGFTILHLAPSGPLVRVTATYQVNGYKLVLESLIAAPRQSGAQPAALSPASTLVAHKVDQAIGAKQPTGLDPTAFGRASQVIAPFMSDACQVAAVLLDEQHAAAAYDAMVNASHALAGGLSLAASGQTAGVLQAAAPASTGADGTTAPASPVVVATGGGATGGPSEQLPSFSVATNSGFALGLAAGSASGGDAAGTDPLSATFRAIGGVAVGPGGDLYVSDSLNNQVRRVRSGVPVAILAGDPAGASGVTGDGGPAASALFKQPTGLAWDAAHRVLLVADSGNDRVRAFTPAGRMSTYAGGGLDSSDAVAQASQAALQGPTGLALDGNGDLFLTEARSGKTREVNAAGALSTIATLTPGTLGPIAADLAGSRLWVGSGSQVRVLNVGGGTPLNPTPVFDAGSGTVRGLAFDQLGTLYAAVAAADGSGAIYRLPVDSTGQLLSGRAAERLAGSASGAWATPAAGVANALNQRVPLFAGALAIDLSAAADAATAGGALYLGAGYHDATSDWAQLLQLTPMAP